MIIKTIKKDDPITKICFSACNKQKIIKIIIIKNNNIR